MNFIAILETESSQEQEQRIINASSWSKCLEYCEGTGLIIRNIQSLPSVNVVIHDSGSSDCYHTVINSDGSSSRYFVYANSLESFNTWLGTLTNSTLQSLQIGNKIYVTVP